jgi:two-component system, sensor histidine kinase
MMLRLDGAEVRVAGDTETALALCAEWVPDAAIIDIGLPGADGHALARALRAKLPDRALYLIAYTGWDGEDEIRRSVDAGFDAYLVKPATPDRIRALLPR